MKGIKMGSNFSHGGATMVRWVLFWTFCCHGFVAGFLLLVGCHLCAEISSEAGTEEL
jgi:hypothetical protein